MKTRWKFLLAVGFLEVLVSPDGDQYQVSYAGNQGATLTSVEALFDGAFGAGEWLRVSHLSSFKETGSPDYLYTATFHGQLHNKTG